MIFKTQSSPHIKSSLRTDKIMLNVIIALIPALALGIVHFGFRALAVTLLSLVSSLMFETLWCILLKKKISVTDGSAAVTALLFAMTLPHTVPYWQVILGSFFAIIIIKGMFGGLGHNIFNPALAGRAFILLVSPLGVTSYDTADAVSSATPLHNMAMNNLPNESILDMFLGKCPGSIGEISALALIFGGAYLVIFKVINLRIPLCYIGTLALLSLVFFKGNSAFVWMAYSVLSGGLILGAVFMATDYVTSPITPIGQIIYGVLCGLLTFFFRRYGLYPEGVTYAILIMNACVFAVDRYTAPRRFGTKKERIKP